MQFKPGKSLVYSFMRAYVFVATLLFFRRTYFKGIQGIPKDAALIFAPNHQSAFMDAIMATIMVKPQCRFLVRADIFKRPIARKLLTSFNLLPIYRMRDGIDSMEKNELIFQTSQDVLLRKEAMILFPEGNQANQWKLRPLKKGYARIAFGALARSKPDFPIYIIPTGINYYDFTGYRGDLAIEYGTPIPIQEYRELLAQNEPKAVNQLKNTLSSNIQKLMFHIQDSAHYEVIKSVSHALVSSKKTLEEDFETRKAFFKACETNPALLEEVKAIQSVFDQKQVNTLDYRLARRGKLFVGLAPLVWFTHRLALWMNYPAWALIENFIQNKVKDIHFIASLRLVLSFVVYPIYYLLILGLVSVLFSWGIGVVVFTGILVFSFFGILAGDLWKAYQKRTQIKAKVGNFKAFEQHISLSLQKLMDYLP